MKRSQSETDAKLAFIQVRADQSSGRTMNTNVEQTASPDFLDDRSIINDRRPDESSEPQATDIADLEWTLEWITITRLQPIIEAFDDDTSGFITIVEVNNFTTACPYDWRCEILLFHYT